MSLTETIINALQSENDDLEKENKELVSELESLRAENERLASENLKLLTQNKNLQSENSNLMSYQETITQNLTSSRQSVTNLQNQITKLTSDLESLKISKIAEIDNSQLAKLESEFYKKLENLENEIKSDCEIAGKTLQDLSAQYTLLEIKFQTLQTAELDEQELFGELENDFIHLANEYKALQEQL